MTFLLPSCYTSRNYPALFILPCCIPRTRVLTEITTHTVSVTDSFLSYIEIIRQRCYLKNNTLYLNLWLNIKNKAAIKTNDAIIWLNLHANNIDLKADGVNGGRAFFIIDDNCIKLNVFSGESDDTYLLICPVTVKNL